MDEKIARRIVEKYLEKRQTRFKMRKEREAGPDILIEGVALEVKGSDLNEKETLKQLTRYVSEYAGLIFAFPLDKLSLYLLYSLYYLEAATKHVDVLKPRSIRVLLLAEIEGLYFAVEHESVESLLKEIGSKLAAKASLPYGTKPQEIEPHVSHDLSDIEGTVQTVIREELEKYSTVYKLEIN